MRYEAAQNYLWIVQDEISNVIAIFGDDEECSLAAAALNAFVPPSAQVTEGGMSDA